MKPAVLSVHGLSKNFIQGDNSISILKNVNASFVQGSSYAIMGVSGTGKSTFMHLLAGLDEPTSGHVSFDGQALDAMPAPVFENFLNKSLGLVFQSPYLIKELSVLENIMVPGLIAGKSNSECSAKARELLAAVGIENKADSKPGSLSGGQQQRVALARALCNDPVFLIADEPTGNLDSETGKKIIDLLLQLQRKYHMGIIVSTHDSNVAQQMQERFQLRDGMLHII